ncbi:MAG: hypothetical protein K0S47_1281 [Herbinix sp.]|jgi:DNA-directed RNA polymerase alpha subunit|nr:hypothetical protein [Herbinix sp.]
MLPDITTIKMGQPAHRALKGAGITTLEQVTQFTEKELLALHGFGPKALNIIKTILTKHGLSLKS